VPVILFFIRMFCVIAEKYMPEYQTVQNL